jgi:hypothetical protein
VDEFLGFDRQDLIYRLGEHTRGLMLRDADSGQIEAWRSSAEALRGALTTVSAAHPQLRDCGVVLEFELPRERGRRPDAVLLLGGAILVLEFKGWSSPLQAHVDQVKAYARDLAAYHGGSHDQTVMPILVLGRGSMVADDIDGVRVTNLGDLADSLWSYAGAADPSQVDLAAWLAAPYEPLPALVAAYSGANGPPIPEQMGRAFRAKWATHSGEMGHPLTG